MNRVFAEFVVLLRAERKKAAVLGALGLVLAAMLIKQAPGFSPRSASASSPSSSENADGGAPGSGVAESLAGAGPIIHVTQAPTPRRDLFRFDEGVFPSAPQSAPAAELGPKSEPLQDEVDGERESDAERLVRIARRDAAGLRLTSTLVGDRPIAVIERGEGRDRTSEVVRVGQEIGGFTLIEVSTHAVVLERRGIRVRLERAASDPR